MRARLTTVLDDALDRERLQNLLEDAALAPRRHGRNARAAGTGRAGAGRGAAPAAALHRVVLPCRVRPPWAARFASVSRVATRSPTCPERFAARDRLIGAAEPVVARYERIAFEKDLLAPPGQPPAAFLCPGHPLLDAVLDLTLERHRDLLKRGTVLVDERDPGTAPRVLFYLEHAIQDASRTRGGDRRVVSKRLLYVELTEEGQPRHLHYAPYLDYRPLTSEEPDITAILERPECGWVGGDLESTAQGHAVTHVVPEHLQEIRSARLKLIAKTEAAVKERLTKEIAYWDHRASQLRDQELAGRPGAKLNSGEARRRADTLQARLQQRLRELQLEAQLAPLPPVVLGGVLVVPQGLLAAIRGERPAPPNQVRDTQKSAARARAIIMETERAPRLRAHRPGDGASRVRHREPRPRHRQAALYRGQGPRPRRRHHHRHPQRDPLLAQPSPTTTAWPSSNSSTMTVIGSTTSGAPSVENRTSVRTASTTPSRTYSPEPELPC